MLVLTGMYRLRLSEGEDIPSSPSVRFALLTWTQACEVEVSRGASARGVCEALAFALPAVLGP